MRASAGAKLTVLRFTALTSKTYVSIVTRGFSKGPAMYARLMMTAIMSMAVVGCSAPLVHPNPPTMQYKVQHAVDWQAFADRSIDRFAATLHTSAPNVFVAPGPADMPFARAFRKNLEIALMRHGYPVVETSDGGSVVLNFDVQTYLYGARNEKRLVQYATFWTTVGGIATQLRHIASYDTAVAVAAVAGPVFDVLNSINDTTPAEVSVTLTVTDNTRLHFKDAENFYVQPNDLPFYWTNVPDASPQSISTTPSTTVTLPVVAMRANATRQQRD
jgi:hypothetical protein